VKYVVAAADEIPPGERKIVSLAGRSIGIFNIDGEYFALRNRCPHQGGALCEGTLWGVLTASAPGEFSYNPRREILTCPWHGWEFHVRTGQSWCDPVRLRVRRFDVTLEPGRALAAEGVAAAPGEGVATAATEDVVPAPAVAATPPPAAGLVRGPYVVETYPVSVEGTYLVVDVPTRGNE